MSSNPNLTAQVQALLAEAIQAKPDWFVTHDKEHFLKSRYRDHLPFTIGTPGDLIQSIRNDLIRYGKSPK